MKIISLQNTVAALALLLTLLPQSSAVFAQGSLTPPGAPAPTMKTLEQIEPRTPIASAPYTIMTPGSYYLTTNVTVSTGDAIVINTSGVTLDLGGFTIASTTPSAAGYGIRLNGNLRDVTILNGHVTGGVTCSAGSYSGPGFGYGIAVSGGAAASSRVAGVSVSGCLYDGINLNGSAATSTLVESCTVETVGGVGIYAGSVRGSVAFGCGLTAIYGRMLVSDSVGLSGTDTGIETAASALNCSGICTNGYSSGVSAIRSADNCYGWSLNGYGISADVAQNCYGFSSTSDGVHAGNALNCKGYCGSGTGIYADNTAQNCFGYSSSGPQGLYARIASFCTAQRTSGTALSATIGNSCLAITGANSVTYKYNMP